MDVTNSPIILYVLSSSRCTSVGVQYVLL